MHDTNLFVVGMLTSRPTGRSEDSPLSFRLFTELVLSTCCGNAINTCRPVLTACVEGLDWEIEDFGAECITAAHIKQYREHARKLADEQGIFNISLHAVVALVKINDTVCEVRFPPPFAAQSEQSVEAVTTRFYAEHGMPTLAVRAKRIPRSMLLCG